MSSTAAVDAPFDATPDDDPAAAADRAYFRALEEHLVQLRGKATMLSPADWQVAVVWRRRGVPLELAQRVMTELAQRQQARSTKRGFSSLRYFRAAIEAAFDEQLAGAAGGVAPGVDPGPPLVRRLAALASAVPASIEGADELRVAIVALGGELEAVETALIALDARLVERARAALPEARRTELDERVESAVRRFASSVPAGELVSLRDRLRVQALRSELELPILSLFSPVALAALPGDD